MSWRRTRAVGRKEFLHILRDPGSLIMALAVPFLMLVLFGYALTLDVDQIPTLVYDQDHSPQSRALVERFRASRYFQMLGAVDEYRVIEGEIDRGRCLMAVVIPRDYGRNIASAKAAEVQILLDGSDSNTASIAKGYAEAVVRAQEIELRSDLRLEAPLEARARVWYNSTLESKNYIVPGLIAVILMVIAALLTSLTIAREWETGTMEQLLSTPLRPAEVVLGKMAAFFAVGLIDAGIAIGIGVGLFQVPLRGNPVLLLATSCLFLFGALCWGILLSAVARSQLLAYQMGVLSSFLPAFLLSGFVFAIENMPAPIQAVTHIVPARYFITVLKGIFLKGVGIEVLWAELAFLALYAGLVFLVATKKLRQKLV